MRRATTIPAVASLLLLLAPILGTSSAARGAAADASTDADAPRAAAVALFKAYSAGDAKTFRAGVITSGEAEAKVADAIAETVAAIGAVRKAAAEKLGAKEAQQIEYDFIDMSDYEKADVHGDRAAFSRPGDSDALVFKKVNGTWKWSLTDHLGGPHPVAPDRAAANVREATARVERVVRAIKSGKLKSADDVSDALHRAIVRQENIETGEKP